MQEMCKQQDDIRRYICPKDVKRWDTFEQDVKQILDGKDQKWLDLVCHTEKRLPVADFTASAQFVTNNSQTLNIEKDLYPLFRKSVVSHFEKFLKDEIQFAGQQSACGHCS